MWNPKCFSACLKKLRPKTGKRHFSFLLNSFYFAEFAMVESARIAAESWDFADFVRPQQLDKKVLGAAAKQTGADFDVIFVGKATI